MLGLGPIPGGGGGLSGLDVFPVVLGATDYAEFDAYTTDHTGSTPCVYLHVDAAAGNVRGYGAQIDLVDDYDQCMAYAAYVTGPVGGAISGNTAVGYGVILTGDDDDTDMKYAGFAAMFNASGGGGEGIAFHSGEGIDKALFSFSGDVVFQEYDVDIRIDRETNGDGNNMIIKAGDGYDSGATDRNGGHLYLNSGEGANSGKHGKVHLMSDLDAGGYWYVIEFAQTADAVAAEVISIPVEPDEVWHVEFIAIGLTGAIAKRGKWHKSATFYRVAAGNVAQQGVTVTLSADNNAPGWAAVFNADVVNNTIDIFVSGVLGDNVDWKVLVKAIKANRI